MKTYQTFYLTSTKREIYIYYLGKHLLFVVILDEVSSYHTISENRKSIEMVDCVKDRVLSIIPLLL